MTQPTDPSGRGLLVLEGTSLSGEVLSRAQDQCIHLVDRVDILLVDPPAAPISLLCNLLVQLERAGVDYRLTSTNGRLADQVRHYLQRFLGITTIIIAAHSQRVRELEAEWAALRRRGCRFVLLAEPATMA